MFNWTPYYANALDILSIALLIYSLLLFIKHTRSFTVFFGLAITIGMYILARAMDLKLTLLALQYFVGISVVIFVVVFQTELRKYFELLGLIGSRQINVGKLPKKSPELGSLVRSCIEMAKNRCGALIVVSGKDLVDDFIDGGIDLDGVISDEIILSIFHPDSDGHDGALIITNNRIAKFGAHLPLSVNFKELGKHGTRHSAGLGLSENIDALCIVVSEEKGTISVCREGKLKTLEDPALLEKELDKFLKVKYPKRTEDGILHIFKHNLHLKLSAIVLALVFWFLNK